MLTLYEELMLLALDEKKGSVKSATTTALPYGLSAAVLLELLHHRKIKCDMNKIVLIENKTTGDNILDDALKIMASTDKIKSIKFWVEKLSGGIKKLKPGILDKLVANGILKKEEHKFIFIPYKRYPEHNPFPEQDLRYKIQQILIHDQKTDERLLSLISLVNACELLNEIVPKKDRKMARKQIKELVNHEPFGKAVSEIVSELNAALVVTTTTT